MCALKAAWSAKRSAKIGTFIPTKQGGKQARTHK